MAFQNPAFLFALFALAIPVLIHLFNFRFYKKIWFTNVRYLAEIKQETKKRSQIRQLLILAARMLALSALVFAFAQPFIPSPLSRQKLTGRQAITVYIDNSFSMEALATNGKLLDLAKAKAAEIAAASRPSDLYRIITNDFEGRHQKYVSRDEFLARVQEVQPSPVSRRLSEVLLRQSDQPGEAVKGNRQLYLVSDFQRSFADFDKARPDTATMYYLVPLAANKTNNLYIDTAWFESPVQQPGQLSRLVVRVRNSGTADQDKVPLQLNLNGTQKAVASVQVRAGGAAEVTMPFTNSDIAFHSGQVELMDYPVAYDNKLYLAYPLVHSIRILAIHEDQAEPFLAQVYSTDSTFRFSDAYVKKLDYSSLPQYSLIILDGLKEIPTGLGQELERYLQGGGSLAVFPPEGMSPGLYDPFLSTLNAPVLGTPDTSRARVFRVSTDSRLFTDVFERSANGRVILPENPDFPVAFLHYRAQNQSGTLLEPLMTLDNGDLFLGSVTEGQGTLYLFTSPLTGSASNFPKHMLFVPVMIRMALLSQPAPALYYYAGSNDPVPIKGDSVQDKRTYKIVQPGTGFEVIPEARNTPLGISLYPRQQIVEAGIYEVRKGDTKIADIAMNYNRSESDLSVLTQSDLNKLIGQDRFRQFALLKDTQKPISDQIHEIQQGKPLWKLFLLLALLFLAVETLLIRRIR